MPEAPCLTLADVVAKLGVAENEIRALGVERLALFGSVLHGRARPDSDVDLLVQFRPGAKSYERFVRLCELLEAQLGHRVELVTTESLSPFIGPKILADAQDVLRAA
jgi:predicted nucleotidyltransferase